MTVVLVNIAGAGLIAWIVWFHWAPRYREEGGVRAMARAGFQEAAITVQGGYSPDVIVLQAGRPIRLHFTRRETDPCSEMVVFDGLERSAKLPTGQEIRIDLPPLTPGEYPFACQMGMLKGKLIVRNG